MSNIVAPYTPNKQQSVTVGPTDVLYIPTYGLAVDLVVFCNNGSASEVSLSRIPSATPDDWLNSPRILLTPGGAEDPGGYLTAVQTIDDMAGYRDLPLAAGQDGWVFSSDGTLTLTWTLRRAKVDTPDFQP